MTVGDAVATANAYLDTFRGVVWTPPDGLYLQHHTGDPGAAGTANQAALTTRNAVTLNAASGGIITLSSLATYTATTTETWTHFTLWSLATGGVFRRSGVLTTPVPVIAGSTVNWTTLTMTQGPIAA